MDWNLIAQGLRLIADGLEDAEGAQEGNDPTPTPGSTDDKPKRHRRTKAEMEAARAAEAAAAATSAASGQTTGTASTTAPGPVPDAVKASPMWQGLNQSTTPTVAAPAPAPAAGGLTPEALSELLTAAAKKHGRTLIAELLHGKRVADMTDAERGVVKAKLDALDAEKDGESW